MIMEWSRNSNMNEYYNDIIWEVKEYDREAAARLQNELGCQYYIAALLVQRNICEAVQARQFLNPGLDSLVDPFLIKGITESVARIRYAIDSHEKVVIYGDYDVDGICSIVILKKCLDLLGLQTDYYIPDRFSEGYGLNQQAVEELVDKGYTLMVTVDCGITAFEETAYAMQHGMDVIITDHHTPQLPLPGALAIINPKLDSIEQVYDLSGAAISFKLSQALARDLLPGELIYQWLDLAALATVADIVPLKGENRILVKYGLEQMRSSAHTGIRCLISELDLNPAELDSWHLGFLLAPKLNSAGRLDTARRSVELLLGEDAAEASRTARILCDMNAERRQIEERILEEAVVIVERDLNPAVEKVLVVACEDWHQGVIGIVASRLVERYNRPVIVISWEGELGRGSARSMRDFDMHAALKHCRDSLISFGGHRMAAGLHLEKNRTDSFRHILNEYASTVCKDAVFNKKYRIDLELPAAELGPELFAGIQSMRPFGEGNPGPQFVVKGAFLTEPALVGRNKEHLRFRMEPGSHPAIAFNLASRTELPLQICKQDFLFRLEENHYKGSSMQLKMRDIKCTYQADDISLVPYMPKRSELLDLIGRNVQMLNKRQPVVYVYPALRAMRKHRAVVSHYFRENLQVELHGGRRLAERQAAEDMLERQAPRLFITTEAYWRSLLEKKPGIDSALCAVYWWPLEEDRAGRKNAESAYIYSLNPEQLHWQKAEDSWEGEHDKWMYYTNRAATLNRASVPGKLRYHEAGIEDGSRRREARKAFTASSNGILLSDGSHTPDIEYIAVADALYLADCPFGLYELAPLIPEKCPENGLPVCLAYGSSDIESNWQFIMRSYPEQERVQQLWEHFLDARLSRIEIKHQDLLASFGHVSGRMLKLWEMRPMLQVLEDHGLCIYHIKGSIITIIIEDRQGAVYTDLTSPLFAERQAEIQCFEHWLNTAQYS